MKQPRTAFLFIAAALALAGMALFYRTRRHAAAVLQPHTVSLQEWIKIPGQAPALSRKIVRAVRADGSVAESFTSYDPKTGAYKWSQRTLLRPGGVYAESSPDIALLSSLKQERLDRKRLLLLGDPLQNCTQDLTGNKIGTFLAREMVLGVETVKIQTERRPGVKDYQWRVPQFGCALVREQGNTMLEPEQITAGEPDASLFEFDPEFTLVSPLEYQRLLAKFITGKELPDSELPPSLFQLDDLYRGNSQRPPAKFDPRG